MPRSLIARAGLLVLLALLLNLPSLGRHELESEEARRLLPARTLLESESDRWVPRVWDQVYVNKPPGFYFLVAGIAALESKLDPGSVERHLGLSKSYREAQREIRIQRFLDSLPESARIAYLRRMEAPDNGPRESLVTAEHNRHMALSELESLMQDPELPKLDDIGIVTPISARYAALLGTILTALALLVAGFRMAPGSGFVAACLYLCMPEVLSKSSLGEIETTFAFLYFVGSALAFLGVERRNWVATFGGGIFLGLATLTKGPFALLFSLPALLIWGFTRGYRRVSLVRVAVVTLLGALPFVLWYLQVAQSTEMGDAILERWQLEASRGGTGGLANWFEDRWRLLSGVAAGWLPASLVVLWATRSNSTRSWREQPSVRFGLLITLTSLLILAAWPGVRARYALPLAPWAALLGGSLLVAATRRGMELPWRGYAARAARAIGLFMRWFAPLAALVLSIAWLVGPDSIVPGRELNFWHVVFLWLLVLFAHLALSEFEEPEIGRWLLVALVIATGLRWVERTAIEAGKSDSQGRAAGALWLADAIDRHRDVDGRAALIDKEGQYNLLAYTGERFRWVETDGVEGAKSGDLLVTERNAGTALSETEAWDLVFPPESGMGRDAWRRIDDLRALVLVKRR